MLKAESGPGSLSPISRQEQRYAEGRLRAWLNGDPLAEVEVQSLLTLSVSPVQERSLTDRFKGGVVRVGLAAASLLLATSCAPR